MSTSQHPQNDQAPIDQKTIWNGHAGRAWVEMQPSLDRLFQPFADRLADAAAALAPRRVLDIGCGAGATTLAIASRLGAASRCTGIDISEPLLATARSRAAQAGLPIEFVCDSAETHTFEPASFDMIASRFGVMFFDDPVRAFANLRRAAAPAARLRMLTWRSPADNPFMTTAERAAAPQLPNLPPRPPAGPGQFAFADPEHVRKILADSGWADVTIEPVDAACTLPEAELEPYFTRLGPLAVALQEADAPTRERVIEAARAAFAPFVRGAEVHFTAACWMVTGRPALN